MTFASRRTWTCYVKKAVGRCVQAWRHRYGTPPGYDALLRALVQADFDTFRRSPSSRGLKTFCYPQVQRIVIIIWGWGFTFKCWYKPGSTRAPGAGQECLFPMVQLYHGQGAAQARAVEGGDVRSVRNVGEWVKWILSSKDWILNILRLKTCFLLDAADSLIFTKGHVDFTAEVETLVDLNYQTRIWLDKNGSSN